MRAFVCTCGQPLFFDNLRCLACGADVAWMLHALLTLDLPVVPKEDDAVHGMAFYLLESLEGEPRVLTGHAG